MCLVSASACWRSAGISYRGEPPDLTSYEKASAFFIFLNMLLAGLATIFGERSSCPGPQLSWPTAACLLGAGGFGFHHPASGAALQPAERL